MMEAEQYFSAERWTARSTCSRFSPVPVTTKYGCGETKMCAFDLLGFQCLARDDEVKVDLGEDLRILGGTLGAHFQDAVCNGSAASPEDVHHIIGGATPGSDQNCLHRAQPDVSAAALRRAVHHERVPALGLADERDILDPFDARFHLEPGWSAQIPIRMRM